MTNFISTKSWMPGDLLNQLLPSAPGYHRRPRSDCISVDYVVLIQQWVRFVKEGGQSKREKTSVTSSELSLLKNISFLVTTCSFDPLIFYSGYRAFSTPPLFPLCVCKTVIMPEPQKERLHFASTCFWRWEVVGIKEETFWLFLQRQKSFMRTNCVYSIDSQETLLKLCDQVRRI